jgi:RNA polymerase sigma factor (sigma-70 family)
MMTPSPMSRVLDNFRRIAVRHADIPATDGELLGRFLADRDEVAFAGLVGRHGPMVLGVCRRLLGNPHDAEDAFQATFLVLVRKAATVVPRELVGNWLYGVACRTALATRTAGVRRRLKESHVRPAENLPLEADAADHQELLNLLDLELAGLPEKYRAALIYCDLEGKPRKEAARLLDCPEGTLATRLKRGRRLLARRLSARGAAVTVGTLSLLLSRCAARAAVPGPLVVSTVQAALLTATGHAAGVSARVASISEGVVRSMLLCKLRLLAAVVLAVGILVEGVGFNAHPALAEKAQEKNSQVPVPMAPQQSDKADQAFRVLTADHDVVCLRLSPDGKSLATVTWEFANDRIDSVAQMWDMTKGTPDRTLAQTTSGGAGTNIHLRQVAFSRDGKLLAATIDGILNANRYGEIKLWDARTGEEKPALKHDSDIDCVAFTPDGKKVAGGGGLDGTVRIWNTTDGAEAKVLQVGVGVRSVAISPDGKTLAAGCWKDDKQGEVSLWDLESGEAKHRMTDQNVGLIYSVAFSHDGKKVAGAGWDKNVRIWEVETGLLKHVLESPTKGFREVSFSPDGKWLAGAGPADVPIWDVESGKIVRTLRGHRGEVFSAVFSARGDTLTTCGADKSIRFWKLQPAGK